MRIMLIGLRGSGKTSAGRAAAGLLGVRYVDLDDLTARELGARGVREAWERHGEAAFRAAEVRALAAALGSREQSVLALGGGTPTAPGALELIGAAKRHGRVMYLRAPAAVLRRRLMQTGEAAARPSLTGAGTLEEIEAVLAARDPLYLSIADRVIETEDCAVREVAALIVAASLDQDV